jgi:hypothetical protein
VQEIVCSVNIVDDNEGAIMSAIPVISGNANLNADPGESFELYQRSKSLQETNT